MSAFKFLILIAKGSTIVSDDSTAPNIFRPMPDALCLRSAIKRVSIFLWHLARVSSLCD